MSRCDSAAIVLNTSELLPEPDMPVKTVNLRFGISMLMFLRLFSRAPWTRIRSWLSAACIGRGSVLLVVAILTLSPSVRRGRRRDPGPCHLYRSYQRRAGHQVHPGEFWIPTRLA